jgi:hypothetical protein
LQGQFQVGACGGVDEDELKTLFKVLSHEQLCGSQRKEVALEVRRQVATAGLDFAEDNLVKVALNLRRKRRDFALRIRPTTTVSA